MALPPPAGADELSGSGPDLMATMAMTQQARATGRRRPAPQEAKEAARPGAPPPPGGKQQPHGKQLAGEAQQDMAQTALVMHKSAALPLDQTALLFPQPRAAAATLRSTAAGPGVSQQQMIGRCGQEVGHHVIDADFV